MGQKIDLPVPDIFLRPNPFVKVFPSVWCGEMEVLTCFLSCNYFMHILRPFPIAVEFLNMIRKPLFQLRFTSGLGLDVENTVDTLRF